MNALRDYYDNQLYISLQTHQRSFFEGIFLLIFRQAVIYYVALSAQVVDRIANTEESFQDTWRRLLDLDSQEYNRNQNIDTLKNIVYAVFAVNVVLIALLIGDIISFGRRNTLTGGYQRVQGYSMLLFSFITKVYSYIIFLPSIYVSLRVIEEGTNIIGIANIIITVVINVALEIHDFDYTLYKEDQDFLARFPVLFVQVCKILLLIALAFNKAILKWDAQEIAIIVFAVFNIAMQLIYRDYHNKTARKLQMNLMVYLAVSGGVLLINRIGSLDNSIFVQLLCYFPISLKIAIDIEDYYSDPMRGYQKWLEGNHKNRKIRPSLFYIQDILIQLDKFSFLNYFMNEHSIMLESISTAHTQNCQKESCFCNTTVQNIIQIYKYFLHDNCTLKYPQDNPYFVVVSLVKIQKKIKKSEQEDFRKRHLVLHIDGIFQDILSPSSNLIPSHFYYINFLVDQWRSKSNSLYYLETLRSKLPKASFLLRIYYSYSMKKIYALYAQEYQDSCREVVGLVFEDILKEAAQQYESSLHLKLQLLSLLNSDHVHTKLVQQCAFQLFKERTDLRIKLGYLAGINEANQYLKMIHNGYIHNFCLIPSSRVNDLASIKISYERFQINNNSSNINDKQSIVNTNISKSKISPSREQNFNILSSSSMIPSNLKVFQNNFCVLFLSAEHSSLGVIKKSQSSFVDIFNTSDPVGKPINTFIPTTMTSAHNQEIQDFLNCKEKSYPNVIEKSLVLAKSADNFAIPIGIRLSLDHVSQFGQIGFVCSIEAIKDPSFYLLVSLHSMTLHLMCQHFSKQFYTKSFSNPNSGKISASKIFPQLKVPSFFESAKRGFKDTLMILPGSQFFKRQDSPLTKNYFNSHTSMEQFTKLSESDIVSLGRYVNFYVVSLRVQTFKNQQIPCFAVVLQNIEHVMNIFEIHPVIQQIQTELQRENNKSDDTSAKTAGGAEISEYYYTHQMDSLRSQNLKQSTTNLMNTSRINKIQTLNQQSSLFDKHSIRYDEALNNAIKQPPVLFQSNQNSRSIQVLKKSLVKVPNSQDNNTDNQHMKQSAEMNNINLQEIKNDFISQQNSIKSDNNQLQYSSSKDESFNNQTLRHHHRRRSSLQPSQQNLKRFEEEEQLTFDIENETKRTAGIEGNNQQLPLMSVSTRDDLGLVSNNNHQYFSNNYNDFIYNSASILFGQNQPQFTVRHNYQNLGVNLNYDINNDQTGKEGNDNNNTKIIEKYEELKDKSESLFRKQEQSTSREKSRSFESPVVIKRNKPDQSQIKLIEPSKKQQQQSNQDNTKIHAFQKQTIPQSYGFAAQKHSELSSQTHKQRRSSHSPKLKPKTNKLNNKQETHLSDSLLNNSISEQNLESSNSAQFGKQLEINDKSSVNGSRGSTKEALKQIERKIMIPRPNTGLQLLNFLGFLSVILIIIMIIVQELNILQAFTKASIDFNFVSWPMEVSSQLSQIQYYVLMYYMNVLYLFPRLTTSWKTYSKQCISQINYLSGNFTQLWIDEANSQDQYSPYFTVLLDTNVSWIAKRDAKTYKNESILITAQQFYFEQNYINAYKTYLIMQSDGFNQQAILIDNIVQYQSQMLFLKQTIKESSINSLDSILTNTQTLMILCITLSFLVIALIFPMYGYIQYQTEEIFKLMSTIPSNNLLTMQSQVQSALKNFTLINSMDKHHTLLAKTTTLSSGRHDKNTMTNTKKNEFLEKNKQNFVVLSLEKQKKKRNISSTDPLRKFSWRLLGIGGAVFVFVIFLPILHNFLIDIFKTESILNVNVLYSLYNLKNLFSQSIYLTLGNIYWKMAPVIGGMYKGSYFQSMIPSVLANDEVSLSDMTSIIASSSTQTRFDDADYRLFFYPILTTGVCNTLEKYPSFYNVSQYNLDLSICKTIAGGILQKGFQTASRYFFDIMTPAYQVATLTTYPTTAIMQAALTTWEAQVNLKDLNTFFEIMTIIITILKDFMQTKGEKYLSNMEVIEYLLAALQISILFVVFALWWFLFYRRMSEVINKNRRLLSLFEINIVMENSYILSYLTQLK